MKKKLSSAIWIAVVILLSIFVLIPLVQLFITSLSSTADMESTRWLPTRWVWGNYVDTWKTVHLLRYMVNSIVISVSATVIGLLFAIALAYVLDRCHFRFRSALSKAILISQIIPAITLLLPIYVMYTWLGNAMHVQLTGTYGGLISVYAGVSVPLATWLLISGMSAIPRDLDEAAAIDGATHWRVLTGVILPILLPSVAVSAIFAFLNAWNDMLFSSVMTNDATRTLAIGLQEFSGGAEGGGGAVLWNQLMAGALIGSLPAIGFFLLAQRFIVKGLTAGAVRQ